MLSQKNSFVDFIIITFWFGLISFLIGNEKHRGNPKFGPSDLDFNREHGSHTVFYVWLLKFARIVFSPHNNTKQSSTAVSARKFQQSTCRFLKSTGE